MLTDPTEAAALKMQLKILQFKRHVVCAPLLVMAEFTFFSGPGGTALDKMCPLKAGLEAKTREFAETSFNLGFRWKMPRNPGIAHLANLKAIHSETNLLPFLNRKSRIGVNI